jgi:ATP-dependent helicase/nuclease subunit A
MRNLYVAMTRAKERLYVTAWLTYPGSSADRWASLADRFTFWGVKHAPSYIDWIMGVLGLYPDRAKKCCKISRFLCDAEGIHLVQVAAEDADATETGAAEVDATDVPDPDRTVEDVPTASESAAGEPATDEAECIAREIAGRFDFAYPHSAVSDLPAKLSVSRLLPDLLDAEEEQGATLHGVSLKRTPSFLSTTPDALTGAERGTATHLFMQFCDFDTVETKGVEMELLRLVNKQFLSPVMADAVNLSALRKFFESSLYRQMRDSEKILREFRFNVQLSAAEFTKDAARKAALADAKLLVQGVVDCCFLLPDGSVKLVDYKTDRLGKTPAEGGALLWERYAGQLFYYKRALEQILGRRVSELSLYSFCHHSEVPLPENLRAAFGVNI